MHATHDNQDIKSQQKCTSFIERILLLSEDHRLKRLVNVLVPVPAIQKQRDFKAWRDYCRKLAADPLAFYQFNSIIFNDDVKCDIDEKKLDTFAYIHGDLHVGQFQQHFDDSNKDYFYEIRSHKSLLGSISWDLKRLGTNLSLVGYSKGFSDCEIIEVIDAFVQQYINTVILMSTNSKEKPSLTTNLLHNTKKLHEIEWGSIDCVPCLITVAEKMAVAVAQIHYEPPISINSTRNCSNLPIAPEIRHNTLIVPSVMSSVEKQNYLMDDIRRFSILYAEIVRRDHAIFFRYLRNARTFGEMHIMNDIQIRNPLIPTHKVSVLIVGGGIGGLTAALCFAQVGVQVTVLEKNDDFREVGAGMQLAPNCSRILARLGILEKVHDNAFFPQQIVWMDAISGDRLTCLDLGSKFVARFGYPYMVVHRADLLNSLYEACSRNHLITLKTSHLVTNVEERPQSMIVECLNNERYKCEMVIAADGLWSNLRKLVHDDGDPINIGYVTYRGTIGIDQISKGADLKNVQFWIGPDMHIVQYPVRRGELFNQAAVFKSKRQPHKTDQWGTREELNERFNMGCEQVRAILPLLQTNFRWPVYDRNPLSKWSHGRLVLLGDAAHPMLQYAAQGAAQAMEDAWALAKAYKNFGPKNIEKVFQMYEQERIPFTAKVVEFARRIGEFAHQDGNEKNIRDEMLRSHDTQDFSLVEWLYGTGYPDEKELL